MAPSPSSVRVTSSPDPGLAAPLLKRLDRSCDLIGETAEVASFPYTLAICALRRACTSRACWSTCAITSRRAFSAKARAAASPPALISACSRAARSLKMWFVDVAEAGRGVVGEAATEEAPPRCCCAGSSDALAGGGITVKSNRRTESAMSMFRGGPKQTVVRRELEGKPRALLISLTPRLRGSAPR